MRIIIITMKLIMKRGMYEEPKDTIKIPTTMFQNKNFIT